MSAVAYKYVCAECGSAFNASGVLEMNYGEFVMRSEFGEEVYLEATRNVAFNEIADIVEIHPLLLGADQNKIADVVQVVFSEACDPSEKGGVFRIGVHPTCPICSSLDMLSWNEIHPVQHSSIPEVTQNKWAGMTESEKLKAVDKAIRAFL